ncbi:transmembrane protein 91-like [Crotalus adamanteus]|uniref:Transmembrane protein 91-like n=1 Tax=Crotalus adamanteus TaxID=8729 RepID=A0AAW1AWQ5_CROAD
MENIHELQHPLLGNPPNKTLLPGGMLSWASPQDPSGLLSHHLPSSFSWLSPGPGLLPNQLLNPRSLSRTTVPTSSSLAESKLYPELWKCSHPPSRRKKDYIETAFGEGKAAGELPRKIALETDIHTVCYEVGDMELPEVENDSSSDSDTESENSFSMLQPQDYLGLAVFSMLCCFWPLGIAAFYLSQKTNKASAGGDYPRAWTASRQTFALAVLSIILGICTYIGAVVALIAYLSNKVPT